MSTTLRTMDRVPAFDLLLRSRRFDLLPKLLYVRQVLAAPRPCEFARQLYLAHLRAFNGFREEEPLKRGEGDFLIAFERLFESIRDHGFDHERPIRTNAHGDLEDGAHRIAVSAFFGLDISTTMVDTDYSRWWTHRWFVKRGLGREWADHIALERLRLSEDARIVVVHGTVDSSLDDRILSILGGYGDVFYSSDAVLGTEEYAHLVREAYLGENWIEDPETGSRSVHKYVRNARGAGHVRFHVVVGLSEDGAQAAKAAVRTFVGRRHHTIHIPSTHDQNVSLGSALLSERTRALFADLRPRADSALSEQLNLLEGALQRSGIEKSTVCITGSSVMDVLGIRNGRDLDVLHGASDCSQVAADGIGCHCSERDWYRTEPLCIVQDPRLHFYFRGFKFAAPEVVAAMKAARRELPKDLRDLQALRGWRLRNWLNRSMRPAMLRLSGSAQWMKRR